MLWGATPYHLWKTRAGSLPYKRWRLCGPGVRFGAERESANPQLGWKWFGEWGLKALAESLPDIKVLQQINIIANAGLESTTLSLLMEGFRKNTILLKVNIIVEQGPPGERSQELKFLNQQNRFTPLLKASAPADASLQLGIWSRALANVASEPDVVFHVLRNTSIVHVI
jgi:hypothetical protein